MIAALPSPFSRTNARPISLAAFSALVRGTAAVLPDLAAAWMLTTFCTPRRIRAQAWPPGLAPERETVPLEGEQVALYRWGPSLNGRKVLLAHGWSGRSEQFRALVEPLRAQGFAVYAFDQPAHGSSSGKTANIPRFARTLRAIAGRLGSVDALVTHSMGGSAAAYAIAHGLKVGRLVMIAPPSEPRRFIVGFWRSLGLSDQLGERMNRRFERQEGFKLEDVDLAQLAPRVEAQVLVVHDQGDREVPFAEGEQWSQVLPRARLLATQGLGHNRLLGDSAVIDAVTRFVGEGLAG